MFLAPLISQPEPLSTVAAAYEAPWRSIEEGRFDRATGKALDVWLDGFVSRFRGTGRVTDIQIGAWCGTFRSSLRHAVGTSKYDDSDLGVDYYPIGDWHWVNAKAGDVTRSRLYDAHWRQISLPSDQRWNDPWRPVPTELKYGYILADEDSAIAEGFTVPERLEWLKVSGHTAKLVKRFDGQYCLDSDVPVSILNGTDVSFRVKEDPKTFTVCGADQGFTRYLTWKRTPKGIKLVRSEPKEAEVRFIDREIEKALRAKRRNALQRKIVKLWPADPDYDTIEWSEKRPKDGTLRVSFSNEVAFVVEGQPGSYRLLRVGADRSYTP